MYITQKMNMVSSPYTVCHDILFLFSISQFRADCMLAHRVGFGTVLKLFAGPHSVTIGGVYTFG